MLLDKLVRFTGTFRALLFIPYLSSFVMAGIIWTWIFSTDGPLNAALGSLGLGPVPFTSGSQWLVLASLALVSVWKGFGYSMLIFLAGLKAQPAEVHEAARIDGAGAWKSFWYVTLPLLKPVVFFVLVIETIIGFQVFDTIYVMTGGGPRTGQPQPDLLPLRRGLQVLRLRLRIGRRRGAVCHRAHSFARPAALL